MSHTLHRVGTEENLKHDLDVYKRQHQTGQRFSESTISSLYFWNGLHLSLIHIFSAQMQAISDQTRLTKDAVGDLSDAMTAWADEGIGQVLTLIHI